MIALALTASLGLSFVACGNPSDDARAAEPDAPEPSATYQIAVCRSYESPIYEQIVSGFTDALKDTVGDAQIMVNDHTLLPDENGEAVVLSMLSADSELVFSVGEKALSAAASATAVTPIVGAGVINYQDALHLLSNSDSGNRPTGRNVTGISAAPFIPAQLSLLIEATPDLRTVGILYSPVDNNAIYQNEMLENYLDQAGIPWKEYEIAETEEANAEDVQEAADTVPAVILPTTVVAASGKAGPNIEVEDIGEEGSLTGINSPESARTAKISKTWTGGKAELIAAEEAKEAQEATEAEGASEAPEAEEADGATEVPESSEAEDTSELPEATAGSQAAGATEASETPETAPSEDMAAEDVVALACEECSALYISAESRLTDRIDMITQIATDSGVSTIGGDITLGQKTLACMYTDPYDQGYRAGKVACRILVDGEDPSEIKIGRPKEENLQKLYQDSVARRLGLTFPKSFSDIDEFLEAYIPGTNTKRVSKD